MADSDSRNCPSKEFHYLCPSQSVSLTLSVNFSPLTELKIFDLLAFSGYKYIGMVGVLLCHIFLGVRGGQIALLWASGSISYFLVQTLRIAILPEVNSSNYAGGHKRRIYLLLFIGLVQPFLMYWLTSTAIKAAITPHYFGYYSYYSGRYY